MLQRVTFLTFVIFSIFATGVFAQDPSEFIKENRVDEFTGDKVVKSQTTEIVVEQNKADEDVRTAGSWVVYVNGTYGLFLGVVSDNYNYVTVDDAYFVIDGERYKANAETVSRDVDTNGGYRVFEQLVITLDKELRTALETATKSRVKVGQIIYNITDAVDDEVWAVERTVNN